MDELVIGVDLGTTSTKGVLVDPGRGTVAKASRTVALKSDHPGWAEADPGTWWENVCSLIPELLTEAKARSGAVAAIATTGMVPAIVLADYKGRPIRRAILQNDARAGAQIHELADRLAHLDLLALTGSALTQQSVAPKLAWLCANEPEHLAATSRVLGSYDWLALQLGAEPHVEANWALESGMFTLEGGAVLEEVLAAADVEASLLLAPASPGQVVGAVSPASARNTGLAEGTPIVVGGADHVLSAYAAGLTRPGEWVLKLGGAADVLVVTDHPFLDPRLYLDRHPQPGTWLPNGCMATSGSLLRWLQGITGGGGWEALEHEAARCRPAELVCLPYFLGEKSPLHDPDLRGAFVGLHLGHGRGDLYRSALEAVAYGFRDHVEVFNERGVALDQARVTNGGSRSLLWKQILADILGVSLMPVLDHAGAAGGAALVAALGAGLMDDWSAAATLAVTDAPVLPRLEHHERYTEGYRLYREARAALTSISHELAARGTR